MNTPSIHEPRSRKDTWISSLSQQTAAEGLPAFMRQKVPIWTYCGPEIIKRIMAMLLNQIAYARPPLPVHLYEMGCGPALTSLRLLETMREIPELYNNVRMHICDCCENTITALEGSGVFDSHADNVFFDHIDASRPVFRENQPPFMVLWFYLADAMPARNIEITPDGTINEVLSSTHLKSNACVLDTQSRPWVLRGEALAEQLRNPLITIPLAQRSMASLVEQRIVLPIEETIDNPRELADCRMACADLPYGIYTNYSYTVRKALQRTMQQMQPGGVVLVGDTSVSIGDHQAYTEDPGKHVGASWFGGLYYSPIDDTMLTSGLDMVHRLDTQTNPCHTLCLLSNEEPASKTKRVMDTPQNETQQAAEADEIFAQLLQPGATQQMVHQAIVLYEQLPAKVRSRYGVLVRMASALLNVGAVPIALTFSSIAIKVGGHMNDQALRLRLSIWKAMFTYVHGMNVERSIEDEIAFKMVILFWVYQNAMQDLDELNARIPGDEAVWKLRVEIALLIGQPDQAMDAMEQVAAVATTNEDVIGALGAISTIEEMHSVPFEHSRLHQLIGEHKTAEGLYAMLDDLPTSKKQ